MQGWGLGFFRANGDGRVTVHPDGNPKRGLDLYQLAMDLNAQGVGLPLLLRFSDILKARIEALAAQFRNAIAEFGYEGTYTTVYPIKVNQQRHVIEEIVEFGMPLGVGLECGSKAELQAILGITESIQPIIVCNGYKDEEYMRLALMGQKLGHTVFVVLEQLSELDTLFKVADELGVSPTVGVRDQAGSRRLRTLGQERRRKVEVWPERRRADEAAGQAGEPGAEGRAPAGALPSGQPDHRHPVHQGGARGGRLASTSSSGRWASR